MKKDIPTMAGGREGNFECVYVGVCMRVMSSGSHCDSQVGVLFLSPEGGLAHMSLECQFL